MFKGILINLKEIDSIIKNALEEDMPLGDITSESVIPADSFSDAVITAKEPGVLAGIEIAERVFKHIDAAVEFKPYYKDGNTIQRENRLAQLRGPSISLLKGERTALNFLQRMSGIASLTRKFVDAVDGNKTKILDTRKTTPGLRILEKYAVRMGGAQNHRLNLSEMVMLKDNHLKIAGSITEAVRKARKNVPHGIKIEVETTNMLEVKEAVKSGADIIMLDNMPLNKMKEAVEWVAGKIPLEVSGKVILSNVKALASLGVDFISVGSLTHSFKSLDISMDFK